MKHILVYICISVIILVTFTSCFCPVIEFANQDCIEITKQPYNIKCVESELCYFGSYRKKWNFYQFLAHDSLLSLKIKDIKVNYRGKPIKFKLYRASQEVWKEAETIETADSVAFMLSFRGRLREGEELQIVEKVFDSNDSIVTSIRIPSIYHQTHRHLNESSKIYRYMMNNSSLRNGSNL